MAWRDQEQGRRGVLGQERAFPCSELKCQESHWGAGANWGRGGRGWETGLGQTQAEEREGRAVWTSLCTLNVISAVWSKGA